MSEIITISSDDEQNIPKASKGKKSLSKIKHEIKSEGSGSNKVENGGNLAEFQKFLEFCSKIEIEKRGGSARSMKRIKEKFLAKFNAADSEYTASKAFKDGLTAAVKKVEKDPSNLFVHMKQVVDELKVRSKKKPTESTKRKATDEEDETLSKRLKENPDVSETSNKSTINEGHVQKLERLFHKVYHKFQKLNEMEVDWNEEENSSYLRRSRYEKRLYLIWEKWQEARGHMDEVKRLNSQRIGFTGTRFPKLNHAIESHVNKTRRFPDFHDILKLTTETLDPDGGKTMTHDELQKIAAAAFQSLGNQLQKRRVFDFWNTFLTHLPSETSSDVESCDPAEKDENLAKILKENHNQHEKELNEVINQFVDRQVVEKLEPKEVLPGMEDEDSRSEEEEEEEEEKEEQEDNAEDIIAISSISEESDAEAEENGERENGIGDAVHCENDNAEGAKEEVELKKEDEKNKKIVISKVESSSNWLSSIKSVVKAEEAEPVASCSSAHRKNKVKDKSEEKEMNDDTDCDVVLLSGSDSDE